MVCQVQLMDNFFSKYEVYTDISSIYCYKNSNVLKNKYGIRDYKVLRDLEQDIVGAKQQYLLDNPIQGRFTLNHICQIHKFLFEDIYPFAGHFRLESIKKGETVFENEKTISNKLKKLMSELKLDKYLLEFDYEEFILKITYYFAELNYIHPFREGNGRATREFLRLLLSKNGYTVNWSAISVDTLMEAMAASVYDNSMLETLLRVAITKIDKKLLL